MEKHFKSRFVSDLEIDGPNYLVESIIENRIIFLNSKNKLDMDKPKCAFWRKDIVAQNPVYKDLCKIYIDELTFIKDLLKTFSLPTILQYIKDRNIITFVYLKLPKREKMIYNLWLAEIKYQKKLKQQKQSTKTNLTATTKVQRRPSRKNKIL